MARAFGALVFNDVAPSLTRGASGDHAEQSAEAILRNLSLPAAGGAFDRLATGLCAAALALRADFKALERDFPLATFKHFLKRDFHHGFQVVSTRRSALAASATAARLAAEDVVEHREDVLNMHGIEIVPGAPAQTSMSVAVVHRAAFRVAEHFVCLSALLELALGVWIVGVLIRVPLDGESAVRAANFFTGCVARDAEDLVVVGRGAHARVISLSSLNHVLKHRTHARKGPEGRSWTRWRQLRPSVNLLHQAMAPLTGSVSSFSSVTSTSVVSIRPATLAAFVSAVLETNAGSMMPALTRSSYFSVAAL